MRIIRDIDPDRACPAREALSTLPDFSARGAKNAARVDHSLKEAEGLFRSFADIRGVTVSVSPKEFHAVLDPFREARDIALDDIIARADHLALFVVTLGERFCATVSRLFGSGEYLTGLALDRLGSLGTERAADVLQEMLGREWPAIPPKGNFGYQVLRYSPGYCGWRIAGQEALFSRLQPEDIGVRLGPTFLMSPLKSLSGVMIGGSPTIHRITASYPYCESCYGKRCHTINAGANQPAPRKDDYEPVSGDRPTSSGR